MAAARVQPHATEVVGGVGHRETVRSRFDPDDEVDQGGQPGG